MGQLAHETAASLRRSWRLAEPAQRAAVGVGAALVAVGLGHAMVWAVVGGTAEGPLSWRKPVTFGISFGVATATLAWVSQLLALSRRALTATLVPATVANALEVAWVSVQHARGVPSHFNLSTPLDGALFLGSGVAIAVVVVVVGIYAVRSFTACPAPPSTALALRVGLLLLASSLLTGVWMILRGTVQGEPPAVVGAAGSLKGAHAVGMHGIQVLCALAWAASFAPVEERRRTRLVGLAAAGCAVAAGGALVLAGTGAGPSVAAGTAVVGLVAFGLVAAGVGDLVAALRERRGSAVASR